MKPPMSVSRRSSTSRGIALAPFWEKKLTQKTCKPRGSSSANKAHENKSSIQHPQPSRKYTSDDHRRHGHSGVHSRRLLDASEQSERFQHAFPVMELNHPHR